MRQKLGIDYLAWERTEMEGILKNPVTSAAARVGSSGTFAWPWLHPLI